METFPLKPVTLDEALELQFRLVDIVARHFNGYELLSEGDLGVRQDLGRPTTTARVEETLADFFGAPACRLVQGAGTGAIRAIYFALARPGDRILIHAAPVYHTTATTFDRMGLELVRVDFHDEAALARLAEEEAWLEEVAPEDGRGGAGVSGPEAAQKAPGRGDSLCAIHLQHTRQQPGDRYDPARLIPFLKEKFPGVPVVVDDNYAVFKTPKIGIEYGADVSTFSLFKLMGPEGVGCILGPEDLIAEIDRQNYSGGGQVQGWQALMGLRAMISVPVLWAVQGQVAEEAARRLNEGELPEVERCFVANAQDRTLLVRFRQPIARAVLAAAADLGALPHPVGANSRYEITPMFYRVSGTFLESDPVLIDYMIRLNPMRAGADTVIRILREAILAASSAGAHLPGGGED